MPREFYYPPRVGRVTYITPFYVPPSGRNPTPDNWRALRRINRFNFLLNNAVYEPPTPGVPLSNIGPPRRLSELHILGERPSRYYPTGRVWEIDVMKRFNIYIFSSKTTLPPDSYSHQLFQKKLIYPKSIDQPTYHWK